MQKNKFTTAIGLDIGHKRIGVARINVIAKIPEPLITLENNDQFINKLKDIISSYGADLIVVGLPRNMSGQTTEQTKITEDFVEQNLKPNINLPIVFQDETLSSVEAGNYPEEQKKEKGLDAIAAAEILRYFIEGQNDSK